ncbi:MAG TPA: TonB-dependent receptor, partial [Crocinitomicaceae bacterium]|nr:TonB-dependent receptor [Crocinitomicaceae bacterium]
QQYGANVYYNQERNKIVAIPTKNLFVWMIQNVGKVQVIGTDWQYRFSQFWDNWSVSTSVNYTFQAVTDITNRNATTFGNQIAYFPKHIGNLDVSTTWKNLGLSVNFFAVGKRYALNENIVSNEVNGYFTADAQLSYKFKLKDNSAFTLRFMGKNLGNLTYAYVKYYVMPRANFLMVLNYNF